MGLPFWSTTLKGHDWMSLRTISSSNRRPINRLRIVSTWGSKTASRHCGDVLDIEDGVLRVHSSLVLGRLTNQTLLARERDEGGGGEATLLVGNYTGTVRRRSWRAGAGGRILISTLVPS
jgi:hypothetical protein